MQFKTEVVQFRMTREQVEHLDRLAAAVGKGRGDVMRDLVDSAVMCRPVVFANYAQTPVGDQRQAVTNGA